MRPMPTTSPLLYEVYVRQWLHGLSVKKQRDIDLWAVPEDELDTSLPDGVDPRRLIELMGRDKKALSTGLTFVLDGPDGVEVVAGVPIDAANDALAAMAAL